MQTPSRSSAMLVWLFDEVLKGENRQAGQALGPSQRRLENVPPVTLINPEIDPFRSDGDVPADKLKAAANDLPPKTSTGVTHEFFGMDAVIAKVRDFR